MDVSTGIVEIIDSPTRGDEHIEQIRWAATGQQPLWVLYDPERIQAVAYLIHPTNAARFLLGCAHYEHVQTDATAELWVKPKPNRT